MTKTAKKLYLDSDAIERGEDYARRHETKLSTLVNDFLRALPVKRSHRDYSPVVRRLIGAGRPRDEKPQERPLEKYRHQLVQRYGRK
jgi:hypothetical protein